MNMPLGLHPSTLARIRDGDFTGLSQDDLEVYNKIYGTNISINDQISHELEQVFEMTLTPEQEAFNPADDVIANNTPITGGIYREEDTYLRLFNQGLLKQGSDPILDKVLQKHGLYQMPNTAQAPPQNTQAPAPQEDEGTPFDTFAEALGGAPIDPADLLQQTINAPLPGEAPKVSHTATGSQDSPNGWAEPDALNAGKQKQKRHRRTRAEIEADRAAAAAPQQVAPAAQETVAVVPDPPKPVVPVAPPAPEPTIPVEPIRVVDQEIPFHVPVTQEVKKGDPGWTEYVLSLLTPDEIYLDKKSGEKRMKHAGLRRLVEHLIGPIVDTSVEMLTSPVIDNNMLCVVGVNVRVKVTNPSHPAYRDQDAKSVVISWSDVGDSFWNENETAIPLFMHPVASATTAAQTRCFRNLLGLGSGAYSQEECGGSTPMSVRKAHNPDNVQAVPSDSPIQQAQINHIRNTCTNWGVDVNVVIKDVLGQGNLEHLTFSEGRQLQTVVNDFNNNSELIEKYKNLGQRQPTGGRRSTTRQPTSRVDVDDINNINY